MAYLKGGITWETCLGPKMYESEQLPLSIFLDLWNQKESVRFIPGRGIFMRKIGFVTQNFTTKTKVKPKYELIFFFC